MKDNDDMLKERAWTPYRAGDAVQAAAGVVAAGQPDPGGRAATLLAIETAMLIEIDRESWIAGFRDGATRRKGTTVGPPPTVTRDSQGEVRDGYSYNSAGSKAMPNGGASATHHRGRCDRKTSNPAEPELRPYTSSRSSAPISRTLITAASMQAHQVARALLGLQNPPPKAEVREPDQVGDHRGPLTMPCPVDCEHAVERQQCPKCPIQPCHLAVDQSLSSTHSRGLVGPSRLPVTSAR